MKEIVVRISGQPNGDYNGFPTEGSIIDPLDTFWKAERVALFELGQILVTTEAKIRLTVPEISKALRRHVSGDWGNVDTEDWLENDRSVAEGYRISSLFRSARRDKFWIVTEADRSATRVSIPEH